MKQFKGLIPFLLAIALGTIIVFYTINGEEPAFKPRTDEQLLQHKLDSIQSEKETLRQQRDSLYRSNDSLTVRLQNRDKLITQLNQRIKDIRGSYTDVSRDSLGIIMDRRADAGRDN
jgi:peptidoglycan hydrolase CwlO-like protein